MTGRLSNPRSESGEPKVEVEEPSINEFCTAFLRDVKRQATPISQLLSPPEDSLAAGPSVVRVEESADVECVETATSVQ